LSSPIVTDINNKFSQTLPLFVLHFYICVSRDSHFTNWWRVIDQCYKK